MDLNCQLDSDFPGGRGHGGCTCLFEVWGMKSTISL